MGIFRNLFDFNGDGEIDSGERFMEFMAFNEAVNPQEDDEDNDDSSAVLTEAGLDPDILDAMDDSTREQAILSAGLDPEDFDY